MEMVEVLVARMASARHTRCSSAKISCFSLMSSMAASITISTLPNDE